MVSDSRSQTQTVGFLCELREKFDFFIFLSHTRRLLASVDFHGTGDVLASGERKVQRLACMLVPGLSNLHAKTSVELSSLLYFYP